MAYGDSLIKHMDESEAGQTKNDVDLTYDQWKQPLTMFVGQLWRFSLNFRLKKLSQLHF